MTTEELEQIEDSTRAAKVAVERGEAFKRLLANEDYALVITQGYIQNHAAELGKSIALNTGAYDTNKLIEDLKGINSLVGYGFKISGAYHAALQTIQDNEEFIASGSNVEED